MLRNLKGLTSITTVNSRPFTFVGESIKDGQVITLEHLVLGRALKTVPDIPHGKQCEAPIDGKYLYRQRLIDPLKSVKSFK